MKRSLALLLIVCVMIGVSGCMGKKDVNEAALEQMERRYGEKFTYEGPYGNSMGGTRQFMASCESLDGLVLVEAENFRKGPVTYRDNYLAVQYREETEEFFRACAGEEFGEVKVSYAVRRIALSGDLAADASFEQYLAEGGVPLSVYIGVKESAYSSEEQIRRMAERIGASGAEFYMSLLVLEDGAFAALEALELERTQGEKSYVRCAAVEELGGDVQIRWVEG